MFCHGKNKWNKWKYVAGRSSSFLQRLPSSLFRALLRNEQQTHALRFETNPISRTNTRVDNTVRHSKSTRNSEVHPRIRVTTMAIDGRLRGSRCQHCSISFQVSSVGNGVFGRYPQMEA
ncbi:hypothetical protein AcW1_005512 [Taiwanofungus camphoratus]|nr:hypothetical protein AcW2_004280 [Antrodia cinnamomea]KAI0933775.1 hypothetical protein AcV5_005834 [Antrodia cinnamomea]KAI0956963.1 hypothetical protein AcW1_005512 [Antrodia cinnamomea]